jgi:hypothetical protein
MGPAGDPPPFTIHRFALASSGGVALGVYEAGVLSQLYRDLAVLNRSAARGQVVIDAIAGSSAGSLTGILLAQAVANETPEVALVGKMWDCWVEGTDVIALLRPPFDPAVALFPSRSVERIAGDAVAALPADDAFDARKVVALWMTMTNLEGIPRSIRFPKGGSDTRGIEFHARSYRDYAPYFVCGPDLRYVSLPTEALSPERAEGFFSKPCPVCGRNHLEGFGPGRPASERWWAYCHPAGWGEAIRHALVSGSFPVAFKSRPLKRRLALFPEFVQFQEEQEPGERGLEEAVFHYVDGGIFNNQPIGRAIDAVSYLERLDPSRRPDPERAVVRSYLVVEPDPTTPKALLRSVKEGGEGFPDGKPFGAVLAAIVSAYFSDALYSDFEQAAKTNQRIRDLEALGEGPFALAPGQMEEVKKRVGLDYKSVVTLERIPLASPGRIKDRLAGAFAGHFGGFLDRSLRVADFRTGQYEARQWLLGWLEQNGASLGFDAEERRSVLLAESEGEERTPDAPWSPLENPPDPHTEAGSLAGMSWDKLPLGRQARIWGAGMLRGGGLAARQLGIWTLTLVILLLLVLLGLWSSYGRFGYPGLAVAVGGLLLPPLAARFGTRRKGGS